MTIERDKFLARLAEARAAGLVDIKFCFQPSKGMKPDEIFGTGAVCPKPALEGNPGQP